VAGEPQTRMPRDQAAVNIERSVLRAVPHSGLVRRGAASLGAQRIRELGAFRQQF
jgi:hypothetical protein